MKLKIIEMLKEIVFKIMVKNPINLQYVINVSALLFRVVNYTSNVRWQDLKMEGNRKHPNYIQFFKKWGGT